MRLWSDEVVKYMYDIEVAVVRQIIQLLYGSYFILYHTTVLD